VPGYGRRYAGKVRGQKDAVRIMFFKSPEKRLCELLNRAEAKFRALGTASIWSSYDSGIALADFVAKARSEIENDIISQEYKSELWGIFAPTCDWDDTVGDVDLGNDIFSLLDQLYGDFVKAQHTDKQPPT
jgi:acyl carrier protein phosphodiesterase